MEKNDHLISTVYEKGEELLQEVQGETKVRHVLRETFVRTETLAHDWLSKTNFPKLNVIIWEPMEIKFRWISPRSWQSNTISHQQHRLKTKKLKLKCHFEVCEPFISKKMNLEKQMINLENKCQKEKWIRVPFQIVNGQNETFFLALMIKMI